jgi:hypothetical protein
VNLVDFEGENVFSLCFENWMNGEETTTPGGGQMVRGGVLILVLIFVVMVM